MSLAIVNGYDTFFYFFFFYSENNKNRVKVIGKTALFYHA